jgi:hypothetical protein
VVAHASNPSYSGGRDQEEGSVKPARAKQTNKLITKKKDWWSGSRPLVEWP